MEDITKEETLFLSSTANETNDIYDAIYHLPIHLLEHKSNERQRIKLLSFTCKHSWYNIDTDRNNVFTYREDTNDYTVTLTPGNYDINDLEIEISTQLNAVASNYTYAISYSSTTSLFTFTRTLTGISKTVSFVFDSTYETEEILGFMTTATFTGVSLSSTHIISIGNEENLFLRSNYASSYLMNSDGISRSKIFGKVPILQPLFGLIHWEMITDNHAFDIELHANQGNMLHLRLTNENNRVIKLQNHYSLMLKVITYKKDTTNYGTIHKMLSLILLNQRK